MIPLEKVVSHASATGARQPSANPIPVPQTAQNDDPDKHTFHRGMRRKGGSGPATVPKEDEDGVLNIAGRFYNAVLNFSVVTRYLIYVLPLALLLGIPIIVGATVARKAEIGGVRIVWLFTVIVWMSLWASKIVAIFLPRVFQFIIGVVSPGVRKYALVLRSLEIPLSLVGWALASLLTFTPLMLQNPDTHAATLKNPAAGQLKDWQNVLRQILGAMIVCTLIFLGERLIIQAISINYHGKQFDAKIKENKHQVYLISLLYDASRAQFPEYCDTFIHEDYIINDALNLSALSKKGSGKGSGTETPMRFIHQVGRIGDNVTSGKLLFFLCAKQTANSTQQSLAKLPKK